MHCPKYNRGVPFLSTKTIDNDYYHGHVYSTFSGDDCFVDDNEGDDS